MNTGLTDQLETYFSALDETQGTVSADHVADRLANVRELPAVSTSTRTRPRWWIAAAAAAIVLIVVGLLPLLFTLDREGTPPATEPTPSVTTGVDSPTTTLPGSDPTSSSLVFVEELGWTWQPIDNYPGLGAHEGVFAPPVWAAGGAWIQIVNGECQIESDPDPATACTIAVSEDGTNWTVSSVSDGDINSFVAYNGVVAFRTSGVPGGDNHLWITRDGSTWDIRPFEVDTRLFPSEESAAVVYLDEAVIAADGTSLLAPVLEDLHEYHLGKVSGRVYSSSAPGEPFAVTLQHPSTGLVIPYVIEGTAFALLNDAGQPRLWESSNGLDWQETSMVLDDASAGDVEWRSVLVTNGAAVGFGRVPSGSGYDLFVASSRDGVNWTTVDPRLADGTSVNEVLGAEEKLWVATHMGHVVLQVPDGLLFSSDAGSRMTGGVLVMGNDNGQTWYPVGTRPSGASADMLGTFAYAPDEENDYGSGEFAPRFWVITPPGTQPAPTVTDAAPSAGWDVVEGTIEEIPNWVTGKLNGEYIALRPGISAWSSLEDGTVEIDDPDGDERAWIYRSPDGIRWTRQPLPIFDGSHFEAGISEGVVWANPRYPEDPGGTYGIWRSDNGTDWEPVRFNGVEYVDGWNDSIAFGEWLNNGVYRSRSATAGGTMVAMGNLGAPDGCLWVSTDGGRDFDCVQPDVALGSSFDNQGALNYASAGHVGSVDTGFFITLGVETGPRTGEAVTTQVLYSPDGYSWEIVDLGDFEAQVTGAATVGNTTYIITAGDEIGVYAATSTDTQPVSFEPIGVVPTRGIDFDGNRSLWTLFGGDQLTLVRDIGFHGPDSVWVSADGVTWEAVPADGAELVMVAGDRILVPDPAFEHVDTFQLWSTTP